MRPPHRLPGIMPKPRPREVKPKPQPIAPERGLPDRSVDYAAVAKRRREGGEKSGGQGSRTGAGVTFSRSPISRGGSLVVGVDLASSQDVTAVVLWERNPAALLAEFIGVDLAESPQLRALAEYCDEPVRIVDPTLAGSH